MKFRPNPLISTFWGSSAARSQKIVAAQKRNYTGINTDYKRVILRVTWDQQRPSREIHLETLKSKRALPDWHIHCVLKDPNLLYWTYRNI